MSLVDGNEDAMFATAPFDDLLDGLSPETTAWLLGWRDDLVEPIAEDVADAHIASAVAAARGGVLDELPPVLVPLVDHRRSTGHRGARRLAKVAVGASASFVAMTGLAAASVLPAPAARGFVYVADALGVPVPSSITQSAEGTKEEVAVAAPAGVAVAPAAEVTEEEPQASTTETVPPAAPTTAPPTSVTATTVVVPAETVTPPLTACASPSPEPASTNADASPTAPSSTTTTTAPATNTEPPAAVCSPSDGTTTASSSDGTATAGGTDDGTATASGSDDETTTTTTAPDGGTTTTTAPPESTTTTTAPDDGIATAASDPGVTSP